MNKDFLFSVAKEYGFEVWGDFFSTFPINGDASFHSLEFVENFLWNGTSQINTINTCAAKNNLLSYPMKTTPLFKVVKIMRVSGRRQVIRKNLSEGDARILVGQYPNSNRSMVVYFRQ